MPIQYLVCESHALFCATCSCAIGQRGANRETCGYAIGDRSGATGVGVSRNDGASSVYSSILISNVYVSSNQTQVLLILTKVQLPATHGPETDVATQRGNKMIFNQLLIKM